LHVGRALSEAKTRGKSDEDYEVRYFDERYDQHPDMNWPDVVGISSMTGYQLKGAIRLLKEAKSHGKRTILGGIHVSMQPDQCLSEDYVDAVVLSEGEWGVLEAIHGGPKQRVHSHLMGTQDHVSPVSSDTLIHFKRSARTGDTVLMTSRGCPFRCGFSVSTDAEVSTPTGPKMAGDVRVGDFILGYDDLYQELKMTTVILTDIPEVVEEIFIEAENGLLICSPEHPIMTRKGWVLASLLTQNSEILSQMGFSKVNSIVRRQATRPQINIQCEPYPTFVAGHIVTHNCYIQQFFERAWQPVDMDRWRYDVLYLKENAGVNKYEHGDDWIGKWPRARQIIKFLWDNGLEYRPSIRAHQINDDVAREMYEMGIKHISVGMETASKRMLELTQKDITIEDQLTCATSLAKHGIWPLYYWITGFPTETPEEINETLDMADRIYDIHLGKLTQNFYAYTALPGSPLFDLVEPGTLPQTMSDWSNYSLNQTLDERASNLYHIGGLHFHRGPGDKTDRNFPGTKRFLIAPFENLASWRWKNRQFTNFGLEKWAIEKLLKWASRRYELKTTGKKVKDVDIADWGVRENQVDKGARGEFMTGEINK